MIWNTSSEGHGWAEIPIFGGLLLTGSLRGHIEVWTILELFQDWCSSLVFLVYEKGTGEVRLLLESVGQAERPDQGMAISWGQLLGRAGE